MLKRFFLLFVFCAFFSGCSSPTRVYYWQKANTGTERFVNDHNACLEHADYYPFKWVNPYPMTPDLLNLKLDLKNGGIWGNYSPYPGAMPVFVNNVAPSKTLIYWMYSWCMKRAGYKERQPFGDRLQ